MKTCPNAPTMRASLINVVISLRSLLYSVSHSARTENVRRERASMSIATKQDERSTTAGGADRPAGDTRAERETKEKKNLREMFVFDC